MIYKATMLQAVDVVGAVLPNDYYWSRRPTENANQLVASRRGVIPGFSCVRLVRANGGVRCEGPGAIGDRRIGERPSDAQVAVDLARAALLREFGVIES